MHTNTPELLPPHTNHQEHRDQKLTPVSGATQGRANPLSKHRNTRNFWFATGFITVWGICLITALIWVSGGGIQTVFGFDAEAINAIGRFTGLASAVLLLLQVMLMSRLPVFERGFGRDTITRMHKATGFWSFWLLIAHIALLVIGNAAQTSVSLLAQLWDFVVNYPGMMLATLGTGMLVAVVVTSIKKHARLYATNHGTSFTCTVIWARHWRFRTCYGLGLTFLAGHSSPLSGGRCGRLLLRVLLSGG